jgi:integrase
MRWCATRTLPAHRALRDLLDATPHVSPIVMVGARGRPYTVNGFQRRFFGLVRRLTDAGLVESGLSFHGLRHTVATMLADAGCDASTIAAVLGQRTTAMAEHYSRTADRRRRANEGIKALEIAEQNEARTKNGKPLRKTRGAIR